MTFSLDFHRESNLDHALLGESEERSLLTRAVTGDEAAIAKLVENNQRLVMRYALRYYHSGMAGNHDLMDLVQYGNLGLLEAIRRWDGRNLRFSTYATWWVRALIRRGSLTQGNSVPRTVREGDLVYQVFKARSALEMRLKRSPSMEEIAAQSGISVNLVNQVIPMLKPILSLYEQDNSGRSIADSIPSDLDTAQIAEERIEHQRLLEALALLDEREAKVLSLRYALQGETATYKDIARRLGISHTRAQQLERQGLDKLRRLLE